MSTYNYRFVARMVIEAATPLSVGSGNDSIITDHLVTRDANGLPYIPGTAIAGILRHAIGKENEAKFFGFRETREEKKERKDKLQKGEKFIENIDEGSKIIFSSAYIVDEDGTVVENLRETPLSNYLRHFKSLPIRQHVRIDEKGTAVKGGKFDNEVVFKGTRFCFEIEMIAKNKGELNFFTSVLQELASKSLRIGSGTRSGYGEIDIKECKIAHFSLKKEDIKEDIKGKFLSIEEYLKKTSSLNDKFWKNTQNDETFENKKDSSEWITYQLNLVPEDFFLFGSGFGNENADMTPVTETYFDWTTGKPEEKTKSILIPGSSIKGALAHRVAFHYNKINKWFVGNEKAKIGSENEAVKALFGYSTKKKGNCETEIQRGNVLISDIIEYSAAQTKILNHVAIDRFTGGAIDGALFSEEVVYGGEQHSYTLFILVNNKVFELDKALKTKIKEAFESTLDDIKNGILSLGGGINRGHGCFNGTWEELKKKEEIK